MAVFEILILKGFTTKVVNLTEENFTFTFDLANRTFELITVHAPKGFTLDVYMIGVDTFLDNAYVYDSNTTMNVVSRFVELSNLIVYSNHCCRDSGVGVGGVELTTTRSL